jgi:hypothetical protein
VSHRGDDDCVGTLDRRRRPPAEHAGKLAQRAGCRRLADDREQERRPLRLDQHLDRAFGRAATLDPLTARLAVGERHERKPDHLRLGARAADPTVQLAVCSHERTVAEACRGRPLDRNDGGKHERRTFLRQAARLDERLHSAKATSPRPPTKSSVSGAALTSTQQA